MSRLVVLIVVLLTVTGTFATLAATAEDVPEVGDIERTSGSGTDVPQTEAGNSPEPTGTAESGDEAGEDEPNDEPEPNGTAESEDEAGNSPEPTGTAESKDEDSDSPEPNGEPKPTGTAESGDEDGEDEPEPADRTIESCTVIDEPGTYELASDVRGDTDGTCLRIQSSDVVLDGDGNAVLGSDAENGIGVQVYSPDRTSLRNVTVRDLEVRNWGLGVELGNFSDDHPVEATLEGVTASGNGNGVRLVAAGGSELRDVTASDNVGDGVLLWETSDVAFDRITVTDNGNHGLHLWDLATDGEYVDVTATGNGDSGIYFGTDSEGNSLSGIYVANNDGPGIGVGDSTNNVVRDALIERNGDPGVLLRENADNAATLENVTVRNHSTAEVDASGPFGDGLTATDLRVGPAATFAFEDEPLSLDDVATDSLPTLPEDATAVSDGVNATGIGESVHLTITFDRDVANGSEVELWRYDGTEWSPVENATVDADAGTVEATISENGVYAAVVTVEDEADRGDEANGDRNDGDSENETDRGDEANGDRDDGDSENEAGPADRTIESCTVLDEPGTYELDSDIQSETDGECLYVRSSDVVLEGNDHEIVGPGTEGSVGVQVSGHEGESIENVTVRNLHVRNWGTGIRPSSWGDPGSDVEVRLENVTATENAGHGVFLGFASDSELRNVTANDNGRNGVEAREVKNTTFTRITADDNGENGIFIRDNADDNEFESITATGNAEFGVVSHLETDRNVFTAVYAADNAEGGVYLDAGSREIRDSVIENNGEIGILASGSGATLENVTVRGHGTREIHTSSDFYRFTATDLRVGPAATFAFEGEPISLDDVATDSLPTPPEEATAAGPGANVTGIDAQVTMTVPLEDVDAEDGQDVQLWRHDGTEWTPVEGAVAEPGADSLEATVTQDGLYAPVVVEESESESDKLERHGRQPRGLD